MAYGDLLADKVQSSTAGTPPAFYDGNSTQIGTLCRAWVNFNGVTTATIRASFNVSSVTRTSLGSYTVNFTTAMPDANYSVFFSGGGGNGRAWSNAAASNLTTSTAGTYSLASTFYDVDSASVAVFR